jgi:uncharacterized membrane protein YtjA (UPF0391 family)
MLKWAIIFAVVAAFAALLGFSGLAGAAAGVAKLLFYAALALCLLLLLLGFTLYWKVARPLLRIWNHRTAHADHRQHRH